jgi:hypothetical protein
MEEVSLTIIFLANITATFLMVFVFWTLHKPFILGWAMSAITLAVLWGWFFYERKRRKSN